MQHELLAPSSRSKCHLSVSKGLFFNAGSLLGKRNELHDFVYSRQDRPIIVGIVESWLHNVIHDDCLNMPDFTILRFDRPKKGGGVMLLISSNYTVINFKCLLFSPIQVLLCEVARLISDFPFAKIIYVYRPPSYDLTSSLSFLKALETDIAPLKLDFPIVVMGDFNFTKIDWATQRPTLNYITADYRLVLASQRAYLTQLVFIPTHINNFTGLVFVSKENTVTNVSVEMPFSTSNHDTICFDLLTTKPLASANAANTLNIPLKYDFSNIDHAGLASSLLAIDWLKIVAQDDNINNAWDSFSLYISSLIAKYTPLKKITFARKTPALPANILHLIKLKKLLGCVTKNIEVLPIGRYSTG